MTAIEEIVSLVRARTGLDLTDYREPTLERRIRNRMTSLGMVLAEDYLRHLEASDSEAHRLLQRVTIKVSRFYRHPPSFELLRERALPWFRRLGGPVRLWSAGCGCGEEAYTLAMLLEEAGVQGHVEATDVDGAALQFARAGIYAERATEELPAPWRERYLESVPSERGLRRRVGAALRRRVCFSRSDLTRPGAVPGSAGFHLVCCRNVLIYWRPEAQARVLENLCAALLPQGFLCLGEAEWPPSSLASRLQPVAPHARVFRLNTGEPPRP